MNSLEETANSATKEKSEGRNGWEGIPRGLLVAGRAGVGLFILGVLYTIYFARSLFLPIFLALFLSAFLQPLVKKLNVSGYRIVPALPSLFCFFWRFLEGPFISSRRLHGVCGLSILGVDVGNSRGFSGRADPHRHEDHLRRYRVAEACRAGIRVREGKKWAFYKEKNIALKQETPSPKQPSGF